MTALQILTILRARFWIVLVAMVATVGAGLAAGLLPPKRYTASAAVLVDVRSPDPISSIIDRGTAPPPNLLATQFDIVKSTRVAKKVIETLNLVEDPAIREEWTKATGGSESLEGWVAGLMQKRLSAKPSASGAIVSIEYEAEDPGFAAAAANAFAQALIETNIEMKVDQARLYSRWFKEQSGLLRGNLEQARFRLSQFQREKGIVARDERLDAETIRLQDLSTRLTVVQAQTGEARAQQRSVSAGDALPAEVAQNPLIAALKGDIVRQEMRLNELASNLGRNHPQFHGAAAELTTLKRRLEIETQSVISGLSAMRDSVRGNEAELKAAVEAQQQKVLLLRSARDQVVALQRDVDAAQNSYDAVEKRFAQINLESQANQSNVSVFSAAIAPTTPSSPNLLRIMLIATILGPLLGAGAAVGLELLDPRVRSVDDVIEMLQFPVLGVIPHVKKLRRVPVMGGARAAPQLR